MVFDAAAWQELFSSSPGLFPACAAFVGLVLASFSGVLVDRLPLAVGLATGVPDETVTLSAPSRCPHCRARLSALALVPVIGWLVYRGRCFSCGAPVPWTYPAVEASAAVISAVYASHFGPTEAGLWALALLWGCLAISWMDWREHWVPDSLSIPLLLAGLIASPFQEIVLLRNEGLVCCWALLWIISLAVGARKQVDAMSGGDLVLAGLGGAWLGMPLVAPFLLIAALAFIGYAVPLQVSRNRACAATAPRGGMENIPYSAPMGPALCLSLLICIWFAPVLEMAVPGWLTP
jgi:leader peptidase (prepilin peptidase)/N-methyltransferase